MSLPSAAGPAAAPSSETVRAVVRVGGAPLRADVEAKLVRAVVDTSVHGADSFELTFLDEAGDVVASAGLGIGTAVEVLGGPAGSRTATRLITGEVTALEAVCADLHVRTVVRGYEKAHRLQRGRRTRTFVDMTDADVARKVADGAGLVVGQVDDSGPAHAHLAQIAQTDWEFLRSRAAEIGFETGVAGGRFYFRRPAGRPAPSGGALGGLASAATSAVAALAGEGPAVLTFKEGLLAFFPRVSAAGLTPDVEVRVWDPDAAQVVVGSAPLVTGTATIAGQDPAALARRSGGPAPAVPLPLPAVPGLPSLGLPPSPSAWVVADRPLSTGSATTAADAAAAGVADHLASSFAEAEGRAYGDPRIQAGTRVEVRGVPATFAGTWTVTGARHVFDEREGGYRTWFSVSGRNDRSLLGLATGGAGAPSSAHRLPGLVCAVVTNVDDDKGRVKVAMPWLSPQYESSWCRVVQFGGGTRSGALFTPDVGDEVLVGFEHADPRRPYVLGGLRNDRTRFDLGGSPVKARGPAAQVVRRGFVSGSGNRLVFEDELAPGGQGPPLASGFRLGTADDGIGLVADQTAGTLTLSCAPSPPASSSATGAMEITCGPGGAITIKAGPGGSVTVDGGQDLRLTAAASVTIESLGVVELKGTQIKLN
jgi:phage protein D